MKWFWGDGIQLGQVYIVGSFENLDTCRLSGRIQVELCRFAVVQFSLDCGSEHTIRSKHFTGYTENGRRKQLAIFYTCIYAIESLIGMYSKVK